MKHQPASPHGPISEVLDTVFFGRGGVKMPMLMPMKIGRSMTILRKPGGSDLTIINSMRLFSAGLADLDALGLVKHVLRLAGFHGRGDSFFRDHYGAKVYAITGQHYACKMDGKPPKSNPIAPDVWLAEGDELPISDARLKVLATSTPPEAVVLASRQGGLLITGDSLQHTPTPCDFTNVPARLMMKSIGFYKPHHVGPEWLRFAKPAAADVRSILDLDFEHVLPGHGAAVIGSAKSTFGPAINGPLKGCHE